MIGTLATITIAASGLILALMSGVGGLVISVTRKWTRIEVRLEELIQTKDDTHKAMIEQMASDRAATNERLTYLERYVWPREERKR